VISTILAAASTTTKSGQAARAAAEPVGTPGAVSYPSGVLAARSAMSCRYQPPRKSTDPAIA
jgi:hypothetical protein